MSLISYYLVLAGINKPKQKYLFNVLVQSIPTALFRIIKDNDKNVYKNYNNYCKNI